MTFSSTIQNQYSTLHGLKLFKYTDLENCKWKIVRQCRFSEELLLSQIYYFHCKSEINFFRWPQPWYNGKYQSHRWAHLSQYNSSEHHTAKMYLSNRNIKTVIQFIYITTG